MRLKEYQPLSAAEEKLISGCTAGGRITIGDGELPEEESSAVTVRAGLIRMLLTRGDPDLHLHDKGLRLRGAWIDGPLDLQGVDVTYDLSLTACRLPAPVEMVNARLRGLFFSGCDMAGIAGDHVRLDGALFLRAGTVVNGEIGLAGARIAGDLQLCDLEITSPGQDAVFAPSMRVEGSVFLGNYPYSNGETTLAADGAVFMASTVVGHDLFITNCALAAKADVIGGVFQGSEEHGADNVLSLARAQIGGILYFKDNQITQGIVSLAGTHVARFRDEPEGPGASYPIRLDGFTYDDFSRHAETDLKVRLAWLERRPEDTEFTAQPYEQLARVLQHMGHRVDARTVLMRKEKILRLENRRAMRNPARRGVVWAADSVMRWAVGYGYRPGRVLALAVVLILALGVFFQKIWAAGDITPNAAPILVSKGWVAATESHPENPAAFWSQKGQAGQDWETFQGFAYAADIVIPIVNLGQESAWAPSTSRSPWGQAGWWIRWFAKAAGWIITALGAAAVTGAVRND
ncbi:hypothetical protein RXV86_18850 [Alisedimentitalea sp. MJ-SS2]|uniref:hypothetical protein n=1 Tax=Aliisedimentitalea sp. MJ-SS2 TaxID=3049795 RepID=UPI002909F5E3|nr:hypothetical protein [Alisedimentitalea sp. MJ-SS2]MDU8929452.1 hypothetical protein [Alisedimentitalea sp. MJ-SS2]